MANEEEIEMTNLDGVDDDLGIDLTITPESAEAKVASIVLIAAAKDPALMKQLLIGVQEAKAAKMSAESILGIFENVITKGLDIVL